MASLLCEIKWQLITTFGKSAIIKVEFSWVVMPCSVVGYQCVTPKMEAAWTSETESYNSTMQCHSPEEFESS
jgi:hypothetical protein